jgi:hypothetical protein
MPTDAQDAFEPLTAARLAGAGGMALVAQAVVDMPGGYFGARDQVTAVGLAYGLLQVLVIGSALGLRLARRPLPTWLAPTLLTVHVGLFLPAVGSDPVVVCAVVGWNLHLLARLLITPTGSRPHPLLAPPNPQWAALLHLALVALGLTVAVAGYHLGDGGFARGACLGVDLAVLCLAAPAMVQLYRLGRRRVLALPVVALAAVAAAGCWRCRRWFSPPWPPPAAPPCSSPCSPSPSCW